MAKYDIHSETFNSLAGKLKNLEGELPEDEKGLLQTILSLADVQLKATEGQDVSGYNFGGSSLAGTPIQVSNVGGLRTGFQSSFSGFAGGGLSNSVAQRAVVISVSF